MNVIFLDFDGVLDTYEDFYDELLGRKTKEEINKKIEKRIEILGRICKKYDCKVVIEAAAKDCIDEKTLEFPEENKRIKFIFDMFKKYDIECIGRTPTIQIVDRRGSSTSISPMNKQNEIMLYLYRHPEIDHYCVIDDYDTKNMLHWREPDLEKIKNHLVETYYGTDGPEEGLLEEHIELVGKALQEENEVKRLIKRRDRIRGRNRS